MAPASDCDLPEVLRSQFCRIAELSARAKPSTGQEIEEILAIAQESIALIDGPVLSRAAGPEERCDVLCIEDDSAYFQSINLLLRNKRKLRLLQAIDGKTGILLAHLHSPRIILLDLDLPDLHGSEVLAGLQKNPATAGIPVVVISGDATPSQIERLLVLGARNYLTKPFNIEPFLAVIDDLLQERAAAR